MKSVDLKPSRGVFVLTDYVLEKIYSQKQVTKYGSSSSDCQMKIHILHNNSTLTLNPRKPQRLRDAEKHEKM